LSLWFDALGIRVVHPLLADIPDLDAELHRLLRQVPRGRVTTYGDIAVALGDVRAARWVAEALNKTDGHDHSDDCSCHRVIRKTGELGGYTGDAAEKETRLRAESLRVDDGRVAVSRCWSDFQTDHPLHRLIELQTRIAAGIRIAPLDHAPRLIAGVDAAFAGRQIIATCVTLSFPALDVVAEWSYVEPVHFPYIPGYLSFRELPALWTLWGDVIRQAVPDLLLVDGNGQLHPRRAGIASCFGLMTGIPTIGIGKSLLCGRVDQSQCKSLPGPRSLQCRSIHDGDEWIGDSVTAMGSSKPIYSSVGHLADRDSIRRLLPALFRDHRLPEPIYQADRLSKAAARQVRSTAAGNAFPPLQSK
jgi:deoxyribonuclease V